MAQKAIVGEKVGMTQVWTADQKVVPVTVLRVEPARIVQVKTGERDGYTALQVTFNGLDNGIFGGGYYFAFDQFGSAFQFCQH